MNETLGPTKYFEIILSGQTKLYYWHTKHMRCNVTQNWNQIEMKNSLLPIRFEGIFFQSTTHQICVFYMTKNTYE